MPDNSPKNSPSQNWISMQEAASLCTYSQEYLSLLARRGKIRAKKLGRNWYTTREALHEYLSQQSVLVSLPKNALRPVLAVEESNQPGSLFEEFKRLNPQIFNDNGTGPIPSSSSPLPSVSAPSVPEQASGSQSPVLEKLDRLSDSLHTFAEKVTEAIPAAAQQINPQVQELIDERKSSFSYRFGVFNSFSKSMVRSPVRLMTVVITAVVMLFILAGGFSFGQVDHVVQQIKSAFKNADTLQGHFPGTHANEVLVLDKAGNVDIYGHIETQGQFRSYAPDGVAPIVVDSMTQVDNLNANYLQGLSGKDFTLAFVTKNGNLTYEDVQLEGNVDVGKTLTVKGATKLLDSLQVYGALGVFSDAVFGQDVTLTGGNLHLDKGTISINNTSLIKNLNAEFLNGTPASGITLQFVTSNGSSTTNTISVGGINSSGPGFFNGGLWSSTGSFGSVGADTIAANKQLTVGTATDKATTFQVYSPRFTVDAQGNTTVSGAATIGGLLVNGNVLSNLIPSGSFNLGSAGNPWANLFAVNGTFTGSFQIAGVFKAADGTAASPSYTFTNDTDTGLFRIGANTLGITAGGAERFRVAGTGASLSVPFELTNTASIGNTLFVQNNGNVGVGTTGPGQFGKLQVKQTSDTSIGGITVTNSAVSSGLFLWSADSTHDRIDAGSAGTDNLILNGGGGNVGIGTTNPSALFQINGTFAPIYLQATGGGAQLWSLYSNNDASGYFAIANGTASAVNAKLVILPSSGNVGVGTTVPTTKFDVIGNASVSGNFEVGGNTIFGGNQTLTGNLTVNGTGSSSFAGSLDITKGLRAANFTQVGAGTSYFNGNLGVGKNSAVTALDIHGVASASGGLNIANNSAINFSNTAGAYRQVLRWDNADNLVIGSGGATSTKLDLPTNGILYVFNHDETIINGEVLDNGSGFFGRLNQLVWTTGGNVGIGSAAPKEKLAVAGTASASYGILSGALNAAFTSGATTSYSRFGTGTTSHSNYINSASDLLVSGNFEVTGTAAFQGNVVTGATTANTLAVTSTIKSDLIPFSNAFNLGSTTNHWGKLYVDTANITTLNAPTASISGTTANDFLINSDNVSNDTENMSVTFKRGLPVVNSALQWDSTNKRFNFNFPVFIQGADAPEPTNNFTNLTLKGALTNQSSHHYFDIQNSDSSKLLAVGPGGWLAASGSFQAGGLSTATASYSRFGTGTTTHGLSAANDLLVTGKAEFQGNVYFNSTAVANFTIASASYFYAKPGTAASPSFSFSSDQDTGIYNPAQETLGFSTFGSERMRIDAAGDISIGTTTTTGSVLTVASSSAILTVKSTGSGGGTIRVDGNSSGNPQVLLQQAATTRGNIFFDNGTGMFVLNRTGTAGSGINVNSSDQVAIGTSTPTAALTVQSAGTLRAGLNAHLELMDTNTDALSAVSTLTLTTKSGTGFNQRAAVVGGTQTLADSGGFLALYTRPDGSGSLTERLRIDKSGNVGIGTTNPSGILDVEANLSTYAVTVHQNGSATSAYGGLFVRTESTGVKSFVVDNAGTDLMTVTGAGNVGIGTTVPAATLEVKGLALVTGVNASPDYLGFDNTANTGGKLWRVGDTGAATTGYFSIYDQTDSITPLTINTAGNVGIGTTGPRSKLEVAGRAAFGGTASASYFLTANTLQVGGLSSVSYNRFGVLTTGHPNYISSNNDLLVSGDLETRGTASFGGIASISGNLLTYGANTFATTGSSTFAGSLDIAKGLRFGNLTQTGSNVNYFAGNVGIGTTGPSGALDVKESTFHNESAGSANGVLVAQSNYAGVNSIIASFQNRNASGDGQLNIYQPALNTVGLQGQKYTAAGTIPIILQNDGGNVGIGTTSPGTPLQVETPVVLGSNVDALTIVGTNANSETLNTTVGLNFNLRAPTPSSNWTYGAIRAGEDSGTGAIYGSLRFLTQKYSAGSVLTEAMRIDHNGNVGIGTMGPAGRLDVAGAERTYSVYINPANVITSWLNQSYDTFTSSGSSITSAITAAGNARGNTAVFALPPGTYTLTTNLTLNSGQAPTLYWNGVTSFQVLVNGANTYSFTSDGSQTYITIFNGLASNYSATFSLVSTSPLIVNTGNVGIGTTGLGGWASPLQVVGAYSSNFTNNSEGALVNIFTNSAAAVDQGGSLEFGGNTGNAVPAYGFAGIIGAKQTAAGDANYGGYLAFRTTSNAGSSATERMRIDSSGNVGIGTTTASQLLTLKGAAGANDLLSIASSSGASILYVTKGGNVGIGTTGPKNKFHIVGAGANGVTLALGNGDFLGSYDTAGTAIRLAGLTTTNIAYFGSMDAPTGTGGTIIRSSGWDVVTISSSSANSQLVNIKSGSVGIGTTAPGAALHVLNSSGDTIIAEKSTGAAIALRRSGTDYALFEEDGSGNLQFFTNGGSLTEKMRITSAGNVGIGTTGPAAMLSVGSGFRVSSAGDITGISLNTGSGAITSGLINGQTITSAANFTGILNVAGNVVLSGTVGVGGSPDTSAQFMSTAPSTNWAARFYRKTTSAADEITIYASDIGGADTGVYHILANGTAGSISDRRFKDNINYMSSGLSIVNQLKPATFNFINMNGLNSGFIAQDVQQVLPFLVSESQGHLLLNYEGIIPYAIAGVNELDARSASSSFSPLASEFRPGDIVSMNHFGQPVLASSSAAVTGVVNDVTASGSVKTLFGGRTAIKVSLTNGAVAAGDRLALSSTQPGVAVKATGAGMIVGTALGPLSSTGSASYGTINAFVNIGYWAPSEMALQAAVASSSSNVIITSSGIFGGVASSTFATINAVVTKVQNLWSSGDIIAEGIRKTYFRTVQTLGILQSDLSNVVANWTTRTIAVSNTADTATKAIFTGSAAQAAEQSKVDLQENGNYLATYGVDSTRGEIQLTGSSQLVNGEADIFFDYSFSSVISPNVPIRVYVTPTTRSIGQLYVATKTQYGFVVKQLNAADSTSFDWLVIARRKGFDTDITASPSPSPTPLTTSSATTTTASSSATPTPSPTASPTPGPLVTASPAPTTASSSATPTPTPSPSPTPIVSATPTPSPTPTITPINTSTPTPTPAPVVSATPTPSPTP